jgi:hypothetical protein
MTEQELRIHLSRLSEWARQKIQGGSEPPWAWFQYMKLVEVTDSLLQGIDSVSPTASLRKSSERSESGLRLVDSTFQQGDAQRRPPDETAPLPT